MKDNRMIILAKLDGCLAPAESVRLQYDPTAPLGSLKYLDPFDGLVKSLEFSNFRLNYFIDESLHYGALF